MRKNEDKPSIPLGPAGGRLRIAARRGLDRRDLDQLFSATYEELRRLAAAVRRGDASETLNPTALVNEVWLKLARSPDRARPHRRCTSSGSRRGRCGSC